VQRLGDCGVNLLTRASPFVSNQENLCVLEPPHVRFALRENLLQPLPLLQLQRIPELFHRKAPANDRCLLRHIDPA
jgi:hypothetical protein